MSFETQLNDFDKDQSALESSVNNGEARLIYIDPDGTFNDWIAVVIESPTKVIYGTQCSGILCEQRYIEGFLIPCGGFLFNTDDGRITADLLTSPFHTSMSCMYNWSIGALTESKLDEIANIIRQVTLWHHTSIDDCTRNHLELDLDRTHEICEAWIPVKTKFGRGVLLWKNCD